MFKRFLLPTAKYLRKIFSFAVRSSWNALNGVAGAALGGVFTIIFGVTSWINGSDLWASVANWLINFLIYTVAAWVCLFLVVLIFVAPFRLWSTTEHGAIDEARRRSKIEKHDKRLAAKLRAAFPEAVKQSLTDALRNEHIYWNYQSNKLEDAVEFLRSAEGHFLTEEVKQRAESFSEAAIALLGFIAVNFFVHPDQQPRPETRYALHPDIDMDRGGNGTDQQNQQFWAYVEELEALVKRMSDTYSDLIRAFHEKLFV